MQLFGRNQPYSEALHVPGDILLEMIESHLDEGLSYLEGDNPRRARTHIAILKHYGSYAAYEKEVLQDKEAPGDILAAFPPPDGHQAGESRP